MSILFLERHWGSHRNKLHVCNFLFHLASDRLWEFQIGKLLPHQLCLLSMAEEVPFVPGTSDQSQNNSSGDSVRAWFAMLGWSRSSMIPHLMAPPYKILASNPTCKHNLRRVSVKMPEPYSTNVCDTYSEYILDTHWAFSTWAFDVQYWSGKCCSFSESCRDLYLVTCVDGGLYKRWKQRGRIWSLPCLFRSPPCSGRLEQASVFGEHGCGPCCGCNYCWELRLNHPALCSALPNLIQL